MRGTRFPDLLSVGECPGPDGAPRVLRCYPLRKGGRGPAPFPTLFWLVDTELCRRLARLEADGWIARTEAAIAADPEFAAALAHDHERYAAERWAWLTPDDRAVAEARGWDRDLKTRGIGGIENPVAVKCLHLHVAHHLARGNAVGAWLARTASC